MPADRIVELIYPGCSDNPTHIQIELTHVRCADNIRISYDFNRDGWIIEQASIFEWAAEDLICDPDWKEVAFIHAWAREQQPDAAP